jgi:acyl-coenzyme A thioesterase PaaI-like protein
MLPWCGMNVTDIPFNRLVGLQADGPVLTLPEDGRYDNHLGTVHASAQFALAEAASGRWLLDTFGDRKADYLAVVRKVELKYRRPATGRFSASAEVTAEEAERFRDTLTRRGRALIEVRVEVSGADKAVTLEASFEWFAQCAGR